ncbi:Fc.00g083470.m01.CDS01 [Cosmosporella sp. VM-42]
MAFGFGEKRISGEKPSGSIESPKRGDPERSVPGEGIYDDDLHVECPSHTTERKLVTKIDFHVIPFLCIMYLLAFLDRVNIANANVFGLSDELNLDGTLYNNALVVFFVPYVIFEIPSNILLKKFKPHVWLSINMFLFGFTTMMQGLVKNYAGLVTTRFFLGLFETGMFPGAFYLIGMWYRRHEAQRRYSFFFNSTTLAGAFGGLLAAAIGKMDGLRGYAGWRWIFILEGGLTVLVSFFFYFLLPNFPEESKWLTEEERKYVTARLQADQGRSAVERKITLRDVGNVLKDYKVILGGFMYFGLIVPAYGYAYFAPGIIKTYGYDPIQTQLHSVPPWAVAFGFSMAIAFISDKTRHRFAFAVFAICVAIAGFGILIAVHDNTKLQYAALFLVAMGAYTAMPIIVCWFNMNLGGHHRRAVGSAWQVGFGNIGGIIAVFAFLQKDAPKYTPGYSICIAFTILSIIACICYGIGCWAANRSRDEHGNIDNLTEEEKTDLGDLSPSYRYLL